MSEFDVRYVADLPIADIRGRLIRNPNYGGPAAGPFGWTWRPEISKNRASKPGFHSAMERSVAAEGVRNPVLVWSFPEGVFLTFGGSRVCAAEASGLITIPAICNDYTGEFSSAPLVTSDNWASYFTDVPKSFEFGPDGFDYHYNLERARRHDHDENGFAWLDRVKRKNPEWLSREFPWISTSTKDRAK